ncbi:MAG: hypothetical protein AB1414_12970, partial [bacterium]
SRKANLKVRTTFIECHRLIRVHLWLISLILCELCASVAERLQTMNKELNKSVNCSFTDRTLLFECFGYYIHLCPL